MPIPSGGSPPSVDRALVASCLNGDQEAWRELIQRYKNLIYSIPRRYGAGPADAADIFQLVCAELFRALPHLRNAECLRAWIVTVASHESHRWKRGHAKRAFREERGLVEDAVADVPDPSNGLEVAERQQVVREAIAALPERDQQMLRMLFYSDPPVPYQAVAARLGLATGSIGLVRARCLKKLEGALAQVHLPRGASSGVSRHGTRAPGARTRREPASAGLSSSATAAIQA